jgi:hypothetical protein
MAQCQLTGPLATAARGIVCSTMWALWTFRVGIVAWLALGLGCQKLNEHQKRGINTQGRQCVECHQTDYETTTNPVHTGLFPTTCADCHSENAWSPTQPGAAFDHPWPLTGRHAQTACGSCHTDESGASRYAGTPQNCVAAGCHLDDYNQRAIVRAPEHSIYPQTCESCHNTTDWLQLSHASSNPFLLPHHGSTCTQCHNASDPQTGPSDTPTPFKPSNAGFSKSNANCISCHAQPNILDKDEHRQAGLSYLPADAAATNAQCTRCHPSGRDD